MNKDYFADERMWAMHRRRWQLIQWWKRKRLLLLSALIIVIWLLATYYDERDKRLGAEAEAHLLTYTLLHAPCYDTAAPASIILAAGSHKDLDVALINATMLADQVRQGWLIAQDRKKR